MTSTVRSMDKHVSILGIFYIAFGVLGILLAVLVFVAVAGGGLISGDQTAIAITATVATAIAGFLLLVSLPSIIGGVGLMRHAPWARIVVLILGVLNLFNIPFGTALGVYTLWVLMNDQVVPLFNSQPMNVAPQAPSVIV
ncbi:MAG TPA: hypothetical protein VNM92_17490 [Thermoanaerobaculia bacterium]|nr:hypothetical protein [Thermoanaerobaculia bacterium]